MRREKSQFDTSTARVVHSEGKPVGVSFCGELCHFAIMPPNFKILLANICWVFPLFQKNYATCIPSYASYWRNFATFYKNFATFQKYFATYYKIFATY